MLEARALDVNFPVFQGVLKRQVGSISAVSNVSLSVRRGETLGLVGESGCGKSTFLKALAALVKRSQGEVRLDDQIIDPTVQSDLAAFRRSVQMVFQDPAESLNSRHSLHQILTEPYEIHGLYSPSERIERVPQSWIQSVSAIHPCLSTHMNSQRSTPANRCRSSTDTGT